MDRKQELFQAILRDPGDDCVRLVYADFLDDHGEPHRADLIRAQMELALLPPRRVIDAGTNFQTNRDNSCFQIGMTKLRPGAEFPKKGDRIDLALSYQGTRWFRELLVDGVEETSPLSGIVTLIRDEHSGPERNTKIRALRKRMYEDVKALGGYETLEARRIVGCCSIGVVFGWDRGFISEAKFDLFSQWEAYGHLLVAAEPITRFTFFGDAGPQAIRGEDGVFYRCWFRHPNEGYRVSGTHPGWEEVFDCMVAEGGRHSEDVYSIVFPKLSLANEALSRACVRIARRKAGLLELKCFGR